jgi:hypothetical protein
MVDGEASSAHPSHTRDTGNPIEHETAADLQQAMLTSGVAGSDQATARRPRYQMGAERPQGKPSWGSTFLEPWLRRVRC